MEYVSDFLQISSRPWERGAFPSFIPRKREDTYGEPTVEIFPASSVQKGHREVRLVKDNLECLLCSARFVLCQCTLPITGALLALRMRQ